MYTACEVCMLYKLFKLTYFINFSNIRCKGASNALSFRKVVLNDEVGCKKVFADESIEDTQSASKG